MVELAGPLLETSAVSATTSDRAPPQPADEEDLPTTGVLEDDFKAWIAVVVVAVVVVIVVALSSDR